ncbi:MAG: methyltransferase domain-containing protein [Candidatus Magasanikbacteria bacterium]|nr:methyltransferase domain-containing protein [Candidatus Magasanikbacteria bacterium]
MRQFDISAHYDLMEQLDRDVHDDAELSAAEVATALRLIEEQIGRIPKSVYLPCFGTGRHIPALLAAGVERIEGVDLSEVCVAKARQQFGKNRHVRLTVGDVREVYVENVDAVLLLGNSFGDIVDLKLLEDVTGSMLHPLRPGGAFVMDYIGTNFLARCREARTTIWAAVFNGEAVQDARTPRFDEESGVMTIDVEAKSVAGGNVVARTAYQKRIMSKDEVIALFGRHDAELRVAGSATQVNPYYAQQHGELGMIAASDWYVGKKVW